MKKTTNASNSAISTQIAFRCPNEIYRDLEKEWDLASSRTQWILDAMQEKADRDRLKRLKK